MQRHEYGENVSGVLRWVIYVFNVGILWQSVTRAMLNVKVKLDRSNIQLQMLSSSQRHINSFVIVASCNFNVLQ